MEQTIQLNQAESRFLPAIHVSPVSRRLSTNLRVRAPVDFNPYKAPDDPIDRQEYAAGGFGT